MLLDAREIPDGDRRRARICILGAGAAGITLARELAGRGANVALVESGGLEGDRETQALYRGSLSGWPYDPLDQCRLRFLGGTTNHWSGWSRPLESIDYEARPEAGGLGWPIAGSALDPYYSRAHRLCGLGPFEYDAAAWSRPGRPLLPFSRDVVESTIYQFSPPVRFGNEYREELESREDLAVYLHANAVELVPRRGSPTLERVRVATLGGRRFDLEADCFVLALGGLENPRLLLHSDTRWPAGIGNQSDQVGRFFMEHPHLAACSLVTTTDRAPSAFYERHEDSGTVVRGCLQTTVPTRRAQKLLGCTATLEPVRPELGARALERILGNDELPEEKGFWSDVGRVFRDFETAGPALGRHLRGEPQPRLFGLYLRAEQAPHPESRVRLTAERDALGVRRIDLHWQLTADDLDSMRRSTRLMARELALAGVGRVQLELADPAFDWKGRMYWGAHHMGTTRMSRRPQDGVVDGDCRVHGVENLYVAGSSVFPTSGSANPTLTLVALALRLADRLHEEWIQ